MTPVRSLATPKIGFLAFFLLWAKRMGWEVPALHIRVCEWLERAWLSGDPLLLLMLPRGHAKSTVLEIFNAWVYYNWPTTRILHQSESDGTALKTSRGTKSVMERHPLTAALMTAARGEIESWWLPQGYDNDPRNANMHAKGIRSNVTSARSDFIQNDDTEVPSNIETPEKRERMRFRLGEQVHIAVPGCPKLYVGTPHTHDSIYEDVKRLGANALVVRMFSQEFRIDAARAKRYTLPFVPEFVFSGIGEGANLLREGVDYRMQGTVLILGDAGGELIDCYADAAWPERFTGAEMLKRRRETRTINEWDSQYQLHAKPVTQVRLDPERVIPYDCEPELRQANNATTLWLGRTQVVGVAARWDPSSGKKKSDVSAVAVVFQDGDGRRYLHRIAALTGEIAEFDDDSGKRITGGQVMQLADLVQKYSLPRVTVETNGIGGFAPTILRAAFKQRRLKCGVVESATTSNKNTRILAAIEPLLLSRGMLWAHVDVLNGPMWDQMRDWNPAVADQPDDLLDAAAGAIAEQPERFRAVAGGISRAGAAQDWRPSGGSFDVEFER